MLSTPFLTTATSRPLEERPEQGQGTLHVIFLQSPITHSSENLWAWCLSLLNPAQLLPDPHSQANNRSTNTGCWVYSCSEQYHVHPLAPGNFSAVKSGKSLSRQGKVSLLKSTGSCHFWTPTSSWESEHRTHLPFQNPSPPSHPSPPPLPHLRRQVVPGWRCGCVNKVDPGTSDHHCSQRNFFNLLLSISQLVWKVYCIS